MADYIKVEKEQTLKQLLETIKKSSDKSLYINIPFNSKLISHRSIIILKKTGDALGKKIYLITSHAGARIFARQVGLNALSEGAYLKLGQQKTKLSSPPARPTASKTTTSHTKAHKGRSPAAWVSQKSSGPQPQKIKQKANPILISISIALALIAGFTTATFAFQEANIEVYTEINTFSGSLDLITGQEAEPEGNFKSVGSVVFEETVTLDGQFSATGEANSGQASSGTAIIFSTYPNALRLNAGTTYLMSEDGQRFHFQEDIQNLRNGVPHQVHITAADGGEAGNLPANARLEVHNAVLGHQPNRLYAQTESDLTGGDDHIATVVSDSDLVLARENLRDRIIRQTENFLRTEHQQELILLPDLTRINITTEELDGQIGEERQTFALSLTAQVSGLAVNRKDIQQNIEEIILDQVPGGEEMVAIEMSSLRYEVRSWNQAEMAIFNASYNAQTKPQLNQTSLKTLFAGKRPSEIKRLLADKPEIQGAKIEIKPFWLNKTPRSINRLNLDVLISEN